jgi:hypothetical protein
MNNGTTTSADRFEYVPMDGCEIDGSGIVRICAVHEPTDEQRRLALSAKHWVPLALLLHPKLRPVSIYVETLI